MTSTGAHAARTSRGEGTPRCGRYELRVTATDAADVVLFAGGWLSDRAMAGWNVSVILTVDCDPTPLNILGVGSRFDGRLDDGDDPDRPVPSRSIAVSGASIAADEALRGDLVRATEHGVTEVVVWGDAGRRAIPGLTAVEHVLTSAARAFKARALQAAGLPDVVHPVESFAGRPSVLSTGYSDLAAVAIDFAQR